MNKIEQIIFYYPEIIKLQKLNLTLVEIQKEFANKNIANFNYKTLTSTIYKIRNNLIRKEFSNIKLFLPTIKDLDTFADYSIKFNGFWICLNNSIELKKEWILTEQNILNIADAVGLIFAKEFLRLFHISNEYLLKRYESKFSMNVTQSEILQINNIPCNIHGEYSKIVSELKGKTLNNILSGIKRHDKTI